MEVWKVHSGAGYNRYWFTDEQSARSFANHLFETDLNGPIPWLDKIKINDADELVQLLEDLS